MSDRISPLLALRRLWAQRTGMLPEIEYTGSTSPISKFIPGRNNGDIFGRYGLWSTDNPMVASTYALPDDYNFRGSNLTPFISTVPPHRIMTRDVKGKVFDPDESLRFFLDNPDFDQLRTYNQIDPGNYQLPEQLARAGQPLYGMSEDEMERWMVTPSRMTLTKPSAFHQLVSPFSDPNSPKFARGGLARMRR